MSTCGACGKDLDPRNNTGFCFNEALCQYRVQNKQPSLGQPRSDPEFEEQRIDDLKDLVLQLVERVERLEQAWRDINSTKRRGDWEKPMGLELKPASEDGHHIARALEKMK